MKFVPPSKAPDELEQWIKQRKNAGQSVHFDELNHVEIDCVKKDPKAAVLAQLVREQGYICPYTLMRINSAGICPNGHPLPATAHIEHIVPRSKSDDATTIEVNNLIACFPKEGNMEFGAHARGNTDLAISPRDPKCEAFFDYRNDGRVYVACNDVAGDHKKRVEQQIEITLCLNHPTLERLRLAALREMGLTLDAESALIKPDDAELLAREIQKQDPQGKFRPFCIAIAQVASSWAYRLRVARAGGIS